MERQWKLRKNEISQFDLRDMYREYGYVPYRMGKFEEYELYMRNRSFLRSDRILYFTDTDGQLRAMKPDVTLSIVKNYSGKSIEKLCYNESVFRAGDSGFRQIQQSGLECIGEVDDYLQSEVVMLALKSLELISDRYLLDISHLGFISAAISELVPEQERDDILRAIGQKNAAGIRSICQKAQIPAKDRDDILFLSQGYGKAEDMLEKMQRLIRNDAMQTAFDELKTTVICTKAFEPSANLMIDLSMMDDLHYYNGIIIRGMIEGIPETLLSGGRYDNLLTLLGKTGKAIGFAVYMDLLERFEQEDDGYAADILLLHEAQEDPEVIISCVRQLQKDGYSVRAQSQNDEIQCRKTATIRNGEVVFDE